MPCPPTETLSEPALAKAWNAGAQSIRAWLCHRFAALYTCLSQMTDSSKKALDDVGALCDRVPRPEFHGGELFAYWAFDTWAKHTGFKGDFESALDEADAPPSEEALSEKWSAALGHLRNASSDWSKPSLWNSVRRTLTPLMLASMPEDAPDGTSVRESLVEQALLSLRCEVRATGVVPEDAESLALRCRELLSIVLNCWSQAYELLRLLVELSAEKNTPSEFEECAELFDRILFQPLADWMPYRLEDEDRDSLADFVLAEIHCSLAHGAQSPDSYPDFLASMILLRKRALRHRAAAALPAGSPMKRYLEGDPGALVPLVDQYLQSVIQPTRTQLTADGWKAVCAEAIEHTIRSGIDYASRPVVWEGEASAKKYVRKSARSILLQEHQRDRHGFAGLKRGQWQRDRVTLIPEVFEELPPEDRWIQRDPRLQSGLASWETPDEVEQDPPLNALSRVYLDSLTPKRRAGVMLVHYYGLKSECAAAWMAVPPNILYGWTCRGLADLRQAAERDEEGHPS